MGFGERYLVPITRGATGGPLDLIMTLSSVTSTFASMRDQTPQSDLCHCRPGWPQRYTSLVDPNLSFWVDCQG